MLQGNMDTIARAKPVDESVCQSVVRSGCGLLPSLQTLVSLALPKQEERIMAKGQMKSNKETRKPKKDAKKPAPAPALKAAPVPAAKIKDKK